MGSFNSLSLGQGLAKEDPFPCLSPPHFPALQLLRALRCSLLSPLPLPWNWAPVVPCLAGSHWSWCRTRLDRNCVFPAPGWLPLFWGAQGKLSSLYLPSRCWQRCWWEVGPGVGAQGLGRCIPIPFNWSSWAPNPVRKPTPFPCALATTVSFGDCCRTLSCMLVPRGVCWDGGLSLPAASCPTGRRSITEFSSPWLGWRAWWGRKLSQLCTGSPALHWGLWGVGVVQLCLVHLCPQLWAGPPPCSREGAHPCPPITVTKEWGSAGMEETRGWHVPSNPHPHGT